MKNNVFYTALDTLHYNTLLSNQVFKIDPSNNLHIQELAPLGNRNETIPLDLIDATPIIRKKLDVHLVFLSSISAILSAIFFLMELYKNQPWVIALGVAFALLSLSTMFSAYKKRSISYTYQFANTNTHLFTLRESYSENKQVEVFVNALHKRIVALNEQIPETVTQSNNKEAKQENKANQAHIDMLSAELNTYSNFSETRYSECMKHLDFLYNHDFVGDNRYQQIEQKIHAQFFGKTEASKPYSKQNIIYFPEKA